MITNFEEVTEDLTEDEKNIFLPALIKGFKAHGKDCPVKEPDITKGVSDFVGRKLTGARLRKLVNYIRVKGLLPLIATTKGYYVSYDKTEVAKQIKSLTERADAINGAANGLKRFA